MMDASKKKHLDLWLPQARPMLEQLCSEYLVPFGFAAAWIEVESGFRIREMTNLDERGFFQLSPEESKMLHLDHAKLSWDRQYSMEAGFELIDLYRQRALGFAVPILVAGSEYHFRLVKLCHSLGLPGTRILIERAAKESYARNWMDLTAYAAIHEKELKAVLHVSPTKWLHFVDDMCELGRPYGLESLSCN